MKKVLLLGLKPEVVDFTQFPNLNVEKLSAGLAAQERALCELGFDAKWCLFDLGETAEAVVRRELDSKEYDVVLFGAGVRTAPAQFLLFEKLLNLVHTAAPRAKLCFNTNPGDTTEAVLRWAQP